MAGGHGLYQEAVCWQSQGVGCALLELSLSGLTHSRQVQVTLCQGPGLQMENTENYSESIVRYIDLDNIVLLLKLYQPTI